jgi:protein-S-isoprenylcysteine O-methyltransferase Ste14
MSKSEDHLPLYGPGPLYVGTIAVLTVAAIVGSLVGVLSVARPAVLVWPMRIAGAALVAGGIALWVAAVFGAKIDEGIVGNHLVTAGAYALVRNPIYTAFSLVCTGVLLAFGNLWLLVLPLVFWLFMTLLMRATEEKWLLELYGQDYVDYCARVNRCIPWFPRR